MRSLNVQPVKQAVVMGALLLSIGCGGSSSSPSAPTTTTAATPTFQNLVGDWSGTQSVVASSSRTTDFSVTCNQAISITKQSGGTFSGTYSVTGSASECVYSGSVVDGTLTTSGTISAKLTTSLNAQADCKRVQGDGVYRGTVSDTKLTLTMAESLDCTNPTETLSRTWTISSSKR